MPAVYRACAAVSVRRAVLWPSACLLGQKTRGEASEAGAVPRVLAAMGSNGMRVLHLCWGFLGSRECDAGRSVLYCPGLH